MLVTENEDRIINSFKKEVGVLHNELLAHIDLNKELDHFKQLEGFVLVKLAELRVWAREQNPQYTVSLEERN